MSLARNRLTPETRTQLRKTVRDLRESLIRDIKESAEQRYLLAVATNKAAKDLNAQNLEKRRRLEAALDQQSAESGGGKDARERAFEGGAKEAGATFLNRLVLIRHLEALGLSKPAVVTGGWTSPGYREFQEWAPALCTDETQGFAALLELLFSELAASLPGLFGDVGLTSLYTIPPATLRNTIEVLDKIPSDAWRDDMTLGWVYQYWNDPDREALDAKIAASGKIEPHEIASKTQMFTERYMVEWLLQNSLGPTWLAMCKKNGWSPEVESSGVLAQLDARRAEWRKKREAGEVPADALMPIEGPAEEAWKYYVPQPMPAAVVEHAPATLKELKLLDPACGSGHFLVVAFDLLAELYREEARHRRQNWTDRQIAEWILENNLHGIDIDPRAVQIAAAAVYLKARALAKDVDPRQVNLVAPALRLSALAEDDEELVRLETNLQADTGIPPELTRKLIETLEGVDHLGSLLKVGDAIDGVLAEHEGIFAATGRQRELFGGAVPTMPLDRAVARQRIEGLLNDFLASHAGAEDLGIRLRGRQLSAGLRFASIAKEGSYHLVVGNPPYQGTSKMKNAGYVAKHYPMGKSDLYAAFLERGLQFCRLGGVSAMVTMRGWMFLTRGIESLRQHLLACSALTVLLDLGPGAFEEVGAAQVILSVCCSVFHKRPPASELSVALRPTDIDDRASAGMVARKKAGILAQTGRHDFRSDAFNVIPARPIVYWWSEAELKRYAAAPKLGDVSPARATEGVYNNTRFIRRWHEVAKDRIAFDRGALGLAQRWAPFTNGSDGAKWFEPLRLVVDWGCFGMSPKLYKSHVTGTDAFGYANERFFFAPGGIAYSTIGVEFSGREIRYPGVFGNKGRSVFSKQPRAVLCLMNSPIARQTMASLNPGVGFEAGDVNRLPVSEVRDTEEIYATLERSFVEHEQAREASIEFRRPGPSTWRAATDWAEKALARSEDEPLPHFSREAEEASAFDRLSFAFGVAMGRFDGRGAGMLDSPETNSLPEGIFFVSVLGADSIENPASTSLRVSSENESPEWLREWLQRGFWVLHQEKYQNRPIYFPLCSAKRSFVAYVSIHRWTPSTLTKLLTDHLIPQRKALEGSLADLRGARATADRKSRSENDRLFAQQSKWLEELEDFIGKVTQCAEKGPPQPDATARAREVDAPYVMDLDDGVMVNAAALWPLLEPMWKDPKKWWKELANAKGRKDYDWSHLAARYFPDRVDKKCQKDPSLAVAHGCFWKYHPEKAYQWELRLQGEIGPDFRITEKDSDALRKAFLKREPKRGAELEAAEHVRRERKANKKDQEDLELSESNENQTDGDEDEAE
jgi:hypothetical protein